MNSLNMHSANTDMFDTNKTYARPQREGIDLEKGAILTEAFIRENSEIIENYFDHFMAYPDIFIDLVTPVNSHFSLYFYQRIFLRACMRFRYHYAVFTRAFSKSFLSILATMLSCIFLPRSKRFICAPVKKQAVQIAKEKVTEIIDLFPIIANEFILNMSNDYVKLTGKNGSLFDVVGVADSARGGRRHGGILEEIVKMDGDKVNEVVLPLMNINRHNILGLVNDNEPHQQQIYVTTAGSKSTYAYERLIDLLITSIVNPSSAFIWGGDYRIPVRHGLLSKKYVNEIRMSSTYKEDSFAREYLSRWTGASDDSWFKEDKVSRHRRVVRAEFKAQKVISNPDVFYTISVDVGRFDNQTAIFVFKNYPQGDSFYKKIVNIIVTTDSHFLIQSAQIKRIAKEFEVREVTLDGNGVGAGLVDFLIIPTICDVTGQLLGPMGIINDDDDKYRGLIPDSAPKILYILKATADINSQMHGNCYTQINSGHVGLLISDRVARAKLLGTKKGQKMSYIERNRFLMPYEMTSRFVDELLNLKVKPEISNISVEKISSRLGKDKFSAFEMGLYRIKHYEEEYYKRKRREQQQMGEYVMFSTGKADRIRNDSRHRQTTNRRN
jgi:hypothetical protein